MVCLVTTISYVQYALQKNDDDNDRLAEDFEREFFGAVTLILLAYQLYHKFITIKALTSYKEYFTSIMHLNDTFWLIITPMIVISSIPTETILFKTEDLRMMSALAVFSMMIKLLDWLRLFDQTAFYIFLIRQTLRDIFAFVLILMLSLSIFGVPMIILNMNRTSDTLVIDGGFSIWPINMFINQYMMALGEYNMDNFESGSQVGLCYSFFIFATFFSSVVMLNMLIAIMGDTFERTIENRELNAVKTKLELVAELSSNIHGDDDYKSINCIYKAINWTLEKFCCGKYKASACLIQLFVI